jgi:hypothetical protein
MLSIRLPEPQLRRFKSIAAIRGVSMQEAVQEALELWASNISQAPLEPLDQMQGSLAGTDFEKLRREDRDTELAHEAALLEES